MSCPGFEGVEQRPTKKRRFFVEDPPEIEDVSHPANASDPSLNSDQSPNVDHSSSPTSIGAGKHSDGFDRELLESIVGHALSTSAVAKLRELSGNDMERAINLYYDGSWHEPKLEPPSTGDGADQTAAESAWAHSDQAPTDRKHGAVNAEALSKHEAKVPLPTRFVMPETQYIGAFGATGWATRSGIGIIKYGEHVKIERAKPSTATAMLGKVGKSKSIAASKKDDTVVRFLNSRNEEVGRLENETAAWVAPLLDHEICEITGTCVYVPERIKINDNIYLQLRVSIRKTALETNKFVQPVETNRNAGLFEAKETQYERKLHLRQVALVRLFNEINLNPSRSNAATEKHKRQGLLKAAEAAERYEQKQAAKSFSNQEGDSSPASEEEEEGEELEQDQLDSLYKKAQSFDFNTPEYEPAPTFVMQLRKYQKQALHWMIGKEKDEQSSRKEQSMHPLWEEYAWPVKDVDDNDIVDGPSKFYVNPYSGELSLDFPVQEQNCLGGILADEMGLGKTIEMLSLIHSHKSTKAMEMSSAESASVDSLPRLPKETSSIQSAPCTTLVVAPMSLIAQWQSEAEKASRPGSLKTLMYYGTEKAINLQTLCCEANAANAPNVVITSYGIVLSEFNQVARNGGNRGSNGGLFSLEYFRIILDEGHYIKNRLAKTSKACYELAARHRWVLTGTPIVNRLEDLFSLVHFLRVEPWSNFSFWKTFITVPFEQQEYVKALDVVQTVLEPLVMRRTKDMKTPEGEALVPLPTRTIEVERLELTAEEKHVYDFIFNRAKRTFAANVAAGTLMKSYTTIFAQILRLRQACCHPVLVRSKAILADEEEAAAAADAAKGLADDMDLQNLIERFNMNEDDQDANKFGAHALKQIQEEAVNECPICCEEPMIEQSVTGCWHSACKKCLVDYIDHQKDKGTLPRCFNCREPINSRDIFEVVRHDDDPLSPIRRKKPMSSEDIYTSSPIEHSSSQPKTPTQDTPPTFTLRRINKPSSAKITALLTQLKSIRRTSPYTKSVIFSQFTSFLDLIEPELQRARIPFLRLDGTLAQQKRADVLAAFSDPAPKSKTERGTVLLLSLRAGGVGLNLTAAERVFMMDPWWSWAVEAQAIDRVHRMGQEKEVKVVRFVCAESIEEKMLRIQERKKFIATSLGMMSEEEKRIQRIEDIRELLT